MQLIGIIFLSALGIRIILLVWSSIARLKWEQEMYALSLLHFRKKVDTNFIANDPSAIDSEKWSGFRDFVVAEKTDEGGGIYSFILKPQDERPLPLFHPGQYLTFQLYTPTQGKPVIRCYSLSDSPNPKFYRVSIKKVLPPIDTESIPPGLASSYFHDKIDCDSVLKVKAPNGEFYLDIKSETPIVLIAGGVGVTPLLSMLNTLADQKSKREIWFFYGIRDGNEHIMKSHIKKLISVLPNLTVRVCYSAGADAPASTIIETQLQTTRSGIETPGYGVAALIRTDSKTRYNLNSNYMTIGRSKSSDIVIQSSHLSAKHASIIIEKSECFLQDLDSKNGTIVNNQLIKNKRLPITHEDIICFGSRDVQFRLVIDYYDNQKLTNIKEIGLTKDPNEYVFTEQRITIDLLKSLLPSNNFDFYICGPPSMMNTLTTELLKWGIPEQKVHYENFGPASVAKVRSRTKMGASAAESKLEVTFSRSNKTYKWNPNHDSLLALAEEMGIPIDSGCRAGNCGTCSVQLNAGRVHYPTPPGANVDTDSCLTCVAIPQTDVSLDA